MISDFINAEEFVNYIVPSKEDLDNIQKKLKNKKDLNSYDLLVLERVRLLNSLLERSRK